MEKVSGKGFGTRRQVQFKDEFLNGTFYKSFRFYDQDAPISLSCSFDTETEDQFDEYTRPKIHFFLGSK